MPDRTVRWRAPGGRSGQFTSSSGPPRRPARTTPTPRLVRAVRAAQPRPASGPLAPLRERLGMPDASDEEVVAAAAERIAPRAAAVPAARPAAPAPLIAAAGPTAEDLAEEARWEEANALLFGLPTGPATAALAAMGAPTPEQARNDAYAAAQRAQDETFARNAEADRLAQVRDVDAARAGRAQVSAEARRQVQDAQDAYLFPELRRP